MFCVNCGAQLEENVKFCVNCGAPIQNGTPDVPEKEIPKPNLENISQETGSTVVLPAGQEEITAPKQTPVMEKTIPAHTVAPVYSSPVEKVKKAGYSGVVLVATILYSLMILLQLVGILTNNATSAGLLPEVVSFMVVWDTLSAISAIIGMTPMFLIVAGLWTNFAQAKRVINRETSGLTLVKSAMVIRLIYKFLVVVVAILFIIFAVTLTATGNQYNDSSYGYTFAVSSAGSAISFWIIALSLLLTQIFPILYDFFAISVINGMKRTLRTGKLYLQSCDGMCILNYIFVLANILGLLLKLVISSTVPSLVELMALDFSEAIYLQNILSSAFNSNIYFIVSQIILIAVLILFNLNLSRYKKDALC